MGTDLCKEEEKLQSQLEQTLLAFWDKHLLLDVCFNEHRLAGPHLRHLSVPHPLLSALSSGCTHSPTAVQITLMGLLGSGRA